MYRPVVIGMQCLRFAHALFRHRHPIMARRAPMAKKAKKAKKATKKRKAKKKK